MVTWISRKPSRKACKASSVSAGSGSPAASPGHAAASGAGCPVIDVFYSVDDGNTGFLIDGRDPDDFAAPVARLLADEILASEMGTSAAARSTRYSWSMTAGRLRRLYGDLVSRQLVRCD